MVACRVSRNLYINLRDKIDNVLQERKVDQAGEEVQQVVKRKSDYLTAGGNAGEGGGFVQAPGMKEVAINLDTMESLHGEEQR